MASRRDLRDLIDDLAPELRDAFLRAVADIRSDTQLTAVIEALESGDIEGALDAIALGHEYFAPLDRAIEEAYWQGGGLAMEYMRERGQAVRFDGRNHRAEGWLRKHSSDLITEIVEDQRNGIRAVLTAGMEAGKNPRATALEIVGRVDRQTGRREGGMIGLTSQQMEWAQNAREELESGDPAMLRAYLERKARDKRFDRTVQKALREGKPVAAADVRRMVEKYEGRLLRLRGETIARTESLASANAAQMEAARQMIDTGAVSEAQVTKVWRSAADGRVRDAHVALNGTELPLGQPFRSPATGALLLHPGDVTLGAPGEDVVACRCWMEIRTDFLAGFSRSA